MNASTLLLTVLVLLAISVLGGLAMSFIRLGGKRNPPPWMSMGHGVAAAAALTLLVYGLCVLPMPSGAGWAAVALGIAGLGGVVMNLGHDQKQKLIPRRLLGAHAVLAIAGLALVALAWSATNTEALMR
jgi:drug/metabolite transporter (DMT)-like permease